MWIPLDGPAPLHTQVYEHVRDAVLEGRLPPGQRLPSSRALADDLGVSRTVVLQAYDRLGAEGFVESRVGAGTFVRADLPLPSGLRSRESTPARPPPRLSQWARRFRIGSRRAEVAAAPAAPSSAAIDFAYGAPDAKAFPGALWRRCLSRAARSVPTGYAHAGGSWTLRRAVAGYLARSRGVIADPSQILVVAGSQQALDLASRLFLDPGDRVVLEEPQYQGARHVFEAAGATLLPVPVDEDGLDTEALPVGSGARLIVVTPSHQFPSGGVLPLSRRLRLLSWAREEGVVVLEDDYDAEYRYDVPPVRAIYGLDEGGMVLHAGTFSKVLFPGLRLGYLVMPSDLVGPALAAKWLTDRHSPVLEQEALARFIEDGHFERHIRRTRGLYGARRRALLDALASELGPRIRIVGADAGMHVLVWLPELSSDRLPELRDLARARGVELHPITPYYLGGPPGAGLLFGYSTVPEDRITEGVRILRETLDRLGDPARPASNRHPGTRTGTSGTPASPPGSSS